MAARALLAFQRGGSDGDAELGALLIVELMENLRAIAMRPLL